jgi:hypothetical protein
VNAQTASAPAVSACDALYSHIRVLSLSNCPYYRYCRDMWSKVFSQGAGSTQQPAVSLPAVTAWDLRQRYQHLPAGKKVCFKDLAIG